jgi:hypothetical protein
MADSPACAGAAASRQIFLLLPVLLRPLFPFLFKLVPRQDIGKHVHIELRLFAQNSDALTVFAPSSLPTSDGGVLTLAPTCAHRAADGVAGENALSQHFDRALHRARIADLMFQIIRDLGIS